jgi:4-hydroxy-3-polyprenylbenzoate decarboxylase
MGIDATNKWPGETARPWGRPIEMAEHSQRAIQAAFDAVMSTPVQK